MAGNRIKGITVEIGGDVTGLDKALKTVNKTIKDTQSQLKDVERLLKLDPGNTELLAQKQKLLKDAVGATKDKLQDLKKAQEQAQKQLANGELGQDKYDALQREIIETEQELKRLEEEAGKSSVALQKIAATGEQLKEVGGKISEVGESLTTHVTAPILAVGAASMAAFGEVDSAIDSMIMKTGAAGTELEKMQQAVENIATTIPTDFQTAADAVGEVSVRFVDVGDDLEELAAKFVQFAAVSGVDVVTAVDNVQASMAAFGEPTSRAGIVLDTLNGIAQQTGVDVNTLTSMLTQNAGVMKEMGMEYEDAAYFMANLNKNGVDVNTTMTALKKAWQTASKSGKSLTSVLSGMNKKIKEAKTDQEAYQAAIELFGAKAGPAIAEAIRDGRLSLEDLNVLMSDYAGNVENTFNATLDPIDQNTMLLNELKLLGAELATTLQSMLLPVMESLRAKLAALREWWAGLDESQKQSIIRIAGIVAAIGPLLVVVGKVVSFVGNLMTMAPMLGSALGALSGPIGIVVAALAALAAVFTHLWKNNEEFRDKVTTIWDSIKAKFSEAGQKITETINSLGFNFGSLGEAIKAAWDWFCNALAPLVTGIIEEIGSVIEGMIDIVTGTIQTIVGLINGFKDGDWTQFLEGLKTLWNGIWEVLSAPVLALIDVIKGYFEEFGISLEEIWTSIKETILLKWEEIKTGVSEKIATLKEDIATKWGEIRTSISEIFTGVKEDIALKWEEIKTDIDTKVTAIKDNIIAKWGTIKSNVGKKIEAIKEDIATKWEEVQSNSSETFAAVKEDIATKWEDIMSNTSAKVSEIKETAVSTFAQMKSDISGKFKEVKEDAIQIFADIKSGITDKIEEAKEAVANVIEAIKNLFNFEIEFPHFKLPHITFSGGWDLSTWPPTIPSFSVEWYKKAMDNGMILNSPTIFGMKDGQLLGAGEAGSETVVGTSSLMKMIQAAVANANQTTYGDMTVNVMSYGTDATTIAEEIGAELNRKLRMAGSW